jgi:glucuronosyltransferase
LFELRLNAGSLLDYSNPFIVLGSTMKVLCEQGYKHPQVQKILKEKYDLIFFTHMFNECLYGLVHKMNTTVIIYQQSPVFPYLTDVLGTPSPTSFVSSSLVGYGDKMSFKERMWNLLKTSFDSAVVNWYYYPLMEKVYRAALNDPTIPPIKEILKNTSLVLTNSHITYQRPRPYLADIIEVGGMHLVPSKPVPKDLEEFISGGKDGFIFFSMGSALKGSQMPEKYRKMFLNVFSKLKQRVLWKWETDTMEGLPANVKLSKWLPQQDILGHKNLRLFITHGGLGSTTESIYHGVPLLGIPIYGDQPSNLRKANHAGFALPPLSFNDLTEEVLLDAINKALNDPSYRENAKKLSSIFLDQQTKPLERAVFWIEYVLRHQGATHLRSAARDLTNIEYYSTDVIAVLVLFLLISTYINFLILRALVRKCFGSKPVSSSKKNK